MATMPWIAREEKYMRYRGKPIARGKFFMTRRKRDIHVYYYTGFQYKSLLQYKCYADYPSVYKLVKSFNANLTLPHGKPRFNHVIGTQYEDGSDQIGYHSDKTRSWKHGTSVAILSLGASREFHLQRIADQTVQVFNFEAGDLFILGWKDNQTHKHSIPKTKKNVGKRVSLCFRSIQTTYTREQIMQKVAKSEKASALKKKC